MRVGFLTYALDRPLTGIGRYTVELICGMAALPDAPEILLLTAGGKGDLEALPHVRLRGCHLLPGLMTLGNLWLPYLAQRYGLDILHDVIGVAPMLLGTSPAKRVVTVHDVIPLSFPGVSTTLDSLIYRHWLPHVLPSVNAIITDSHASYREIQQHLGISPHKLHVIPLATTYQPATAERIAAVSETYQLPPDYILYVGAVEERKNLKRVLQAYARLQAPPKLVIIGPQKWKYEPIFTALEDLNLQEQVIFTGYVPENDLSALYSGATVFVYPSLAEGFGLPVLEAMACGTPVITSDRSSLPEVAGDAALLVNPEDVNALADSMTTLLNDTDLRLRLRQQGLERAAEFSWQQTARRTLQVYHSLL